MCGNLYNHMGSVDRRSHEICCNTKNIYKKDNYLLLSHNFKILHFKNKISCVVVVVYFILMMMKKSKYNTSKKKYDLFKLCLFCSINLM